jgi:hypothetical protein
MNLVSGVLYFSGYTFDFDDNINQTPLDIEVGRNNTYIAKNRTHKHESIILQVLTIMYQIIISFIILWTVGYGLYMAVRDNNINYFGRTLFQVLIVLQYHYAIYYFKNNHFYENILCNTNLKYYITIAIPLTAILSILLATMNVTLLAHNFKFNVYDELYNVSNIPGKTFVCGILFFDSLYSYLTFIINACIFTINMLYHRDTVYKYSLNLKQYIRQNINTKRKLNIIAIEYSQMKENFSRTVELLSPFFSILNFIGSITMYFYVRSINSQSLGVTEFINIALYFITEGIYIISIQTVNNNIIDISSSLNSNSLINTFFSGKNYTYTLPISGVSSCVTGDDYDTILRNNNPNDDNLHIKRHDDTKSKFSFNEKIYNGQNLTFNTVESDIYEDDVELELKPLSSTKFSQDTGEYHRENENIDNNDINIDIDKETIFKKNYNVDRNIRSIMNNNRFIMDNKEDMNTYNILQNIMVVSVSMQQMLDWISLRDIVSSRWNTFRVFGVEYTDTVVIAKIYGVGVAILMSAQLGQLLNLW